MEHSNGIQVKQGEVCGPLHFSIAMAGPEERQENAIRRPCRNECGTSRRVKVSRRIFSG
ncbi:hypothetical protein B4098_2104 [Heyndrickxia coagulans]|uniref:Uncharacterized protein n=1 Tax=Heyndrickxia coagulans TaxID=1398 RepID=A0A150JW90_HEYCO|nr:hypothetical protein B4098_2104 [Heyndrickxia coagulans]